VRRQILTGNHYNTVRPHQGIGNVPLNVIPLPASGPPDPGKIKCDSRLGGLLRHYSRKAA
jgi:putative transposase